MNGLGRLLHKLGGIVSPWPRRLQVVAQVCELALINVELYCKVRALRVSGYGARGPIYLIQLETEAILPTAVLLDVRCYLARKMNDVLRTQMTLEDVALVVVRPAGQEAIQVPHVASRILAHRLAPYAIAARAESLVASGQPQGAANDSTHTVTSACEFSDTVAGGLRLRN